MENRCATSPDGDVAGGRSVKTLGLPAFTVDKRGTTTNRRCPLHWQRMPASRLLSRNFPLSFLLSCDFDRKKESLPLPPRVFHLYQPHSISFSVGSLAASSRSPVYLIPLEENKRKKSPAESTPRNLHRRLIARQRFRAEGFLAQREAARTPTIGGGKKERPNFLRPHPCARNSSSPTVFRFAI